MDWGLVLAVVLLAALAAIMFLFLSGVRIFGGEYTFGATTTTTTSPMQAATTTTQPGPITTTTIVSEYASTENYGTLAWLEKRTFDLVNDERAGMGLERLLWNEEIADVCRLHSKDMADHYYLFNESVYNVHTGSDGSNSSYRLIRDGVLYWNLTGENVAMIQTTRMGMEEVAQEAVEGWMDSPTHRANILRPEFDEAGMGARTSNDTYYFTQDFIGRVTCGYKQSFCCYTKGYEPWCYNPWRCVDGVCN